MIYRTKGIKQSRKYGKKSKRNMRGGDRGQWFVGMPLLVVAGIIVVIFLVVFVIILKGGGGKSRTQ
jgi:uncharacterized membrane protein